ncbi:MAG: 50S ribosomal protein L25, partial [Burkholderiaceae bacterium]
ERVLLRDFQMHPYKPQVLHIDFQRVAEDEAIHMRVPLHFVGEENSPAVKLNAAIISHVLSQVDVACLPRDLPEFIEVDLSGIKSTDVLKVSDLKMPAGVKPVLRGKENPVVVTVSVPGAQAEEDTSAAPTPAAEVPATAQKAPPAAAPAGAAKGGDKKK